MKWLQVRNKTMQDQVVFNTSGDEMRSLLILKACRSVAKLCLTRFDPMDCSTTGSPVLHYLPKFAQVHVHSVGDAWGHTCLFRVYLDLEGLWGGHLVLLPMPDFTNGEPEGRVSASHPAAQR